MTRCGDYLNVDVLGINLNTQTERHLRIIFQSQFVVKSVRPLEPSVHNLIPQTADTSSMKILLKYDKFIRFCHWK